MFRRMPKETLQRAQNIAIGMGIFGNLLLFVGKISIGLLFNSVAIVSDSLNSFTDIIASLIVRVSIRSSHKDADPQHPYGHERAQPIAALVVAIFTGIVGFQIIVQSVTRLLTGQQMKKGILPILLVSGVMVIKLGMHLYVRSVASRTRSMALQASATDHRNDVLISGVVLTGVVIVNMGFPVFDSVIAILVGVWIIGAGFSISRDNIKFLMGESPSRELLQKVLDKARSVEGVIALNDVFAHYVGTAIQIEVHINVRKSLNVEEAHAIGKRVQHELEGMEEISRAFIHIDPLEVI